MTQYCRVFWDYYGPSAEATARHFAHHLEDLIQRDSLADTVLQCDIEIYHDTHAAAYCDATYETGKKLAQALKSKRSILLDSK